MKNLENNELIEIFGGGPKERSTFSAAIGAIGGAIGGAAGFLMTFLSS